ncbi:MAG: hypothetical protein ACOX9R_14120 [Armatimonadota bacterium]|jgi:hypothetical protein
MKSLEITVREMSSLDTLRPVSGGVPIAEGAAPVGSHFRLASPDGADVPLQAEVLGRWKDGSARWVLLDFQSAPPADGEAQYTLTWGEEEGVSPEPERVVCEDDRSVFCGKRRITFGEGGLLSIDDRLDVELLVLDGDAGRCSTEVTSLEVLAAGPLRATIELRGDVLRPDGARWFSFRLAFSMYAGLDCLRFEPLIVMDCDEGLVQEIGGLSLVIVPRDAEVAGWRFGGAETAGAATRLHQLSDRDCRIEASGATVECGRAPGWMEVDLAEGGFALAMRDFWRRWPAALSADAAGVGVELLPAGPDPADFEQMEPWWKYQYFFGDGHYRIRTGQARRWEVWVAFDGGGEALARAIDRPLIPIADPAQAIATGVWDEIMPAGEEMAQYDEWAEKLFEAFEGSIEEQRDYGAMNWGDWYGERRVNWGNMEYDTPNQLLIQFARTGDPEYFYAADAAARHFIEVDTVHHVNDALWDHFCDTTGGTKRGEPGEEPAFPYRRGMIHQHTIGHVSGLVEETEVREIFLEHEIGRPPNPYLCLGPTNLGHIFTQGSVRHHFLTGDRFIRETVEMIGEMLAQLVEDRRYKFMGTTHCGRVTGWTMLALGGAYELGWDDRYVGAMRTLAEDAMADQDPVCGGWLIYPMAPDHCICETERHTGMAGFITSVLINGLSRYYQLSGDERLPESIDRAVTFLDVDTWYEQWRGWSYTSCPGTALRGVNQPGVTMMAHVNGVRFGENPDHLRILRIAWEEKFGKLLQVNVTQGFGKTWTSTMYGCAETAGILARRE